LKKSRLIGALSAAVLSFITLPSHAALTSVLSGLAVYDDVADLSWTTNANINGAMSWAAANTWAASLDIDGVAGADGWRLPSSLNSDGTGPCGPALNCNDSEMGNLFYNVLGGVAGLSITTTHNSNYDLFTNVQPNAYWSSTEYAPNPTDAWLFDVGSGGQFSGVKTGNAYAWAVQSGNVGAAIVPVPAAVWLFGSGLLGLIGLGRQRRR